MLSEDPYFLPSLLEQSYSLLTLNIHDFIKKTVIFLGLVYCSRPNVVTYHNLLNLVSTSEVAVTYLTFKANTNICFDCFKALIISFCQKLSIRLHLIMLFEHGNTVGRLGYYIDKEGYFFYKLDTSTKL